MPAAPIPPDEGLRLSALRESQILNKGREPVFDDIVRQAAQAASTPIALITFISEKTQWFKAAVGLNLRETSRDSAFCAWAIHNSEILWVEDATKDERFFDNPFVHDDPNIRHYAGAPIATPDGYLLGTICVIDRVPRPHDRHVADKLRELSAQVSEALALRQSERHDRGPCLEARK